MLDLTKLRQELQFNKEIGGIINVLRGVASSEFYRLQRERKRLTEFEECLNGMFSVISSIEEESIFVKESPLPETVIMITSDLGFLGKLNVAIVNAVMEKYSGGIRLVIVGRQGLRYLEAGEEDIVSFPGISDEVSHREADSVGNYVFERFFKGETGRVKVVFPHFISFGVWEVEEKELLPCRRIFEPFKGKGKIEYLIVEPSYKRALEYLVRVWVNHILYGILWESKLSEWSARVMHLERSSNEIKEMDKKLKFRYFRLLHENSDKNIREIFSSRLAVSRQNRQLHGIA
ncbi:MAG: F0F1 ATP synthase subunit gamma [Candidatus Aureabacteria bacterium]|nr:F0F1 ATP synthase subunit gamma [Candidatus Auribacterota bacterium]